MAASTEGAELKLVSSIRYKLAAVSSDEKKLSEVLQSQLTLLLDKAGSQHKAVREEVNPHCPDYFLINVADTLHRPLRLL